jgi:hypothetical protein
MVNAGKFLTFTVHEVAIPARICDWGQVIYFRSVNPPVLLSVRVALSPLHHDLKTVDLSLADAFG